MEHWKDIKIDNPSQWPAQTRVELDAPHEDARGSIQPIVNFPVKNVSIITSVKGSLRSNHYHQTDWHYMYTLEGAYDYYFRPTGSDSEPEVIRVGTGDLVFTPPMEDHATVFLEHTVLLVMSRNPRDRESYEADVRRVVLVDPEGYI